jgi:GTPase SAR1 family protein
MNTNSIVWSEEETRYLKALLTFNPGTEEEAKRKKVVEEQQQPVGEFRVLFIGAKGCGKTSILTKVNNIESARSGFVS